MMEERLEELAALYAFDLLEGEERARFETELARNPALQQRVVEFRDSTQVLAAAASAAPPADLRRRVMASIEAGRRAAPAPYRTPNRKLIVLRRAFPWAMAAGFAGVAFWLAQRTTTAEGQVALAQAETELARLGLERARSLFESERIVTERQISDLNTMVADRQQNLLRTLRLATEMTDQLTSAIEDGRRKEAEMAELTARLTHADNELVALTRRMQSEGKLANLKIATLASMLENSPEALAVAVWNPNRQEGVLTVEKLPPLAPDQSYELWVIEAKPEARPVSAGVFVPGSDGSGRVEFKPVARVVETLAKFAVSREKRDGANSHAQPSEVVMISK